MEIQARKEAKRQERINSKHMKRVHFDGAGGIEIMRPTLDFDDSDDDDDPPESDLSGSDFSDTEKKRIADARKQGREEVDDDDDDDDDDDADDDADADDDDDEPSTWEVRSGPLSRAVLKEAKAIQVEYHSKLADIAQRAKVRMSTVARAIGDASLHSRETTIWNAFQADYRAKHGKPATSTSPLRSLATDAPTLIQFYRKQGRARQIPC